ncbi:MAG: hypothetical protein AB2693_34355 [Candidatus Thiodiazotropha sp.]
MPTYPPKEKILSWQLQTNYFLCLAYKFQKGCRPLYCPPGSLYNGCQCSELLEVVSGMPVLLKLKVSPEPGSLYPSTDVQAAQFRRALVKAVQKSIGNVTGQILASFRQPNETNSYQLYVAVVSTDHGIDTKQSLKHLLDYLDTKLLFQVTSSKNKYSVRLSSKILLLSDKRRTSRFESALDLTDQSKLTLDYSSDYNEFIFKIYQEFSPILFCKQVQLESSEFTETNGQIFVNTTSAVFPVYDICRIAEEQVRVCVDQYLRTHMTSSGNTCGAMMIILLLAISQTYDVV